jgi:peroxiredoxin
MMNRVLFQLLMYSSLCASSAWADDADVAAWVRKGGLSPVEPPTTAAPLTLPDLAGDMHQLSDYQGRWVLLTFFATWCGPCASEMPSLERLSQALGDEGFDVLGISTDRNTRPIRGFLKKHGATFSVLHDHRGEAGRAYHAQSIPLSYLIDPSGRVVGVARGAREWDRFEPIARQLLAEAPWDGTVAPATADASAPVELPPGVEPPTAVAKVSRTVMHPGDAFSLDVDVLWQGQLRDYVLLPPKVALPDGVTSSGTKARSSSAAGKQHITYALSLKAERLGEFALDPVELRYTPAGATEPMIAQVQGPTISVVPVSWAGLPPAWWVGGGLGTLLLGGAGLAWSRRTRAGAASSHDAADALASRRETFSAARRKRMDGDIAGFLEDLAGLFKALGEAPPPDLQDLIERARYGGESPSGQRLDALERQLKRALDARRAELAKDDPDFDDGEDV